MKGCCLCGGVSYEIDEPYKLFQYCHCSRCRKVTGSAHASNIYIPSAQFRWLSGTEKVGRFEHPTAKYYASQFCKLCGSTLPWEVKGGGTVVVPAGTLDGDVGVKPKQSVFWGSRASWYEETSSLCKFDELPQK